MRFLAIPFAALALAACGGPADSDLFGDAPEGGADVVVPKVDGAADAAPEPTACSADANNCKTPDVPQGWSAIAYTKGTQTPCPQDYGPPDDGIADPVLGPKACSCSCTKTQDPDCQTGTSTISGIGAQCNGFGATLNFVGGTCRKTGGTVDDYDKATAIAATGGTCAVQAVPNDGAITSDAVRLCPAGPKCLSAACGGYAPKGFTACIVSDGDVACPANSAFSVKHIVGNQVHAACTNCGTACTFQGGCSAGKLGWYSDQNCQQLIVSIPANGTCAQTGKGGTPIGALQYTATGNFSGCTATGTSTASLDLPSPRTVCCRP
ncbi:MAG TPA: hypothetical protein VF316_22415 [Polyangiaceae bacterium]